MANIAKAKHQQRSGLFVGGKTQRDYPEYQCWIGIIQRCYDPASTVYEYYGERGVFMAEEWRHDFQKFFEHVGHRPSADHQLDRIKNEKGYVPGNVRWATRKEQCRNRRSNRFLTGGGQTLLLIEWAERLKCSHTTIVNRIKRGWSEEAAVTTPVKH